MSYNVFKVIHLLGVIVFLGNIIVTGMWKVLADCTGEARVIAYAQRLVTITDWAFTAGLPVSICGARLGSSGASRCSAYPV
jgi:uncharacterized membrane protein